MRIWLRYGLALVLAEPALAEVKNATSHGFEVESRASSSLTPGQLYQAFGNMPRWWSDGHTYSGKAANLSLQLQPGGCWCESLPAGGGVEHMRVAFVDPGKRVVLTGSLGPLLTEATTGVMQVTIAATASGSSLVMNYRASGFYKGGAERLAPLVDKVLAEQLRRLEAHAAAPPSTR